MIMIHMILPIKSLPRHRHSTQPTLPTIQHLKALPQHLGHLLNLVLKLQVPAQKLADLGVLMVTPELLRGVRIRSIYVDVDGAVAVGAPARLAAATDHVRESVGGRYRARDESIEFFL